MILAVQVWFGEEELARDPKLPVFYHEIISIDNLTVEGIQAALQPCIETISEKLLLEERK